MKRGISTASTAQRAKVRDQPCAQCGRRPCDPAHLWPRGRGGCDHPDCVIGLCRLCHRAFDERRLDLLPIIAMNEYAAERSHMAAHADLLSCVERLTGRRLQEAA